MPIIKDVLDKFNSLGREIVVADSADKEEVSAPRNIQEASKNNITFIGSKFVSNYKEIIASTQAGLIIIDQTLISNSDDLSHFSQSFIISPNPKADLITYCKSYLGFQSLSDTEKIHKSASISSEAIIGKNAVISAGVVIEPNVHIGDHCIIGANTVIKANTRIGDHVEIGACNVIGGTGFGYSKPDGKDEYEQFPHYGSVIIKDKVHIGNNTCIDRGSLSDTVLEEGVKVDNLVHIAHNVKIGRNSLIIACSMIAGSVKIGSDCWVAPSSTVINGINIGSRATIGLASTVTKSVDDDTTVIGSPAMNMADFKKVRAHQKKIIES